MPPEEFARVLGRRKALQVIGMALVAFACGPAETTDQLDVRDASDPVEPAPPVPTDDATGVEAPPVQEAPPPRDDGSSGIPEYDPAQAFESVSVRDRLMPPEMIADLEALYAGVWLGAWTDSAGQTGTLDASVGFDPEASALEIAVSASGPILGSSGLDPTSLAVPLGGDFFEFEERDPLGYMYVFNRGDETESITMHDPSGAPELESITIELSYAPDGTAVATYEALGRDGTVTTGTIELARGTSRPSAPSV